MSTNALIIRSEPKPMATIVYRDLWPEQLGKNLWDIVQMVDIDVARVVLLDIFQSGWESVNPNVTAQGVLTDPTLYAVPNFGVAFVDSQTRRPPPSKWHDAIYEWSYYLEDVGMDVWAYDYGLQKQEKIAWLPWHGEEPDWRKVSTKAFTKNWR